MKLSARFNEQGLSLVLSAEGVAEQRMIGAVLGQPQSDRQTEILAEMVLASLTYEGHFSNQRVSSLTLKVLKDQTNAP